MTYIRCNNFALALLIAFPSRVTPYLIHDYLHYNLCTVCIIVLAHYCI